MYLILEEEELKDTIASVYGSNLSIAAKLEVEGGETSFLIVEWDMRGIGCTYGRDKQAWVAPNDNWRRATYLFYVPFHNLAYLIHIFYYRMMW